MWQKWAQGNLMCTSSLADFHFCFCANGFAHSWLFLHQVHDVFIWKRSSCLKGGATESAFSTLCSVTYPKPPQLGWGQVIVDVRPCAAALHQFVSRWDNSYRAWRCVFRFLSSRKADGVPPTELEPEGMLGHWRIMLLCWLEFIIHLQQCHYQSPSTIKERLVFTFCFLGIVLSWL